MFRKSFYPAADARLQSVNASYATALAGGTITIDTTANYITLGQRPVSGYTCWAGLFRFDTSEIPDDAVIEAVRLIVNANANYTDNLVVLRAYGAAFGAGLATDDWVDPRTLTDVLATFDTAGGAWTTSGTLDWACTAAMKAAINRGGYTDLRIVTDREVSAQTPTAANEYLSAKSAEASGTASDPLLVVTWSLPDEDGATRYNYIENPRFAANVTDGWALDASITATRETAPGPDLPAPATACAKLATSAVGARFFNASDVLYPVDAGESIAARCDYYWPGSSGQSLMLGITWLDAYGGVLSTDAAPLLEHNAAFGTATIGPLTAPARTAYAYAKVGQQGTGAGTWTDGGGNCPRVTNVRLDRAAEAFTDYFDGASPAWQWVGTPHNSISYGLAVEWEALSLSVNAGSATTADNDVALAIAANLTAGGVADVPDEMCFSDDGATWGAWEPYATSRAYKLGPQATYPSQPETVYVKFRYSYLGTWYESSPAIDAIDLAVEWSASLRVDGGAAQAQGLAVTLDTPAASSAGAVIDFRLRENGGAWSAWLPYLSSLPYTLGDYGTRDIEVQYRDADGNTFTVANSTDVLEPGVAAGVAAVGSTQAVITGILAYHGNQLLAELEAVDGSVSVDARRAVWRTASFSLAPTDTLTHRAIYDLLVTPGLEIIIRRGWLTPAGQPLVVPLGRFVVDEVTFTEGEAGTEVTVSLSDLSVRIQRARWTTPYTIAKSTPLVEALADILMDRWDDVTLFLDAGLPNTIEAPVLFEAGDSSDPWADAQGLAQAHGYVLYFDADGVVRLETPPDSADVQPSRFYHRDERAVVTALSRTSPMERTYNGVIVTGEGSTLPSPVRGEAWDEEAQSPTCVDGPFGRLPYFYSSPLITTAEQAEAVAASLLAKVLGRVETLTWEQIPDPAVQPLEAVEVEDDTGALHTYIIDELSIPLSATEIQTATARETRIAY